MKHTISICMGSSCFARGNKRNLKLIEEYIAKYHIDCALTGRGCVGKCRSVLDGYGFAVSDFSNR